MSKYDIKNVYNKYIQFSKAERNHLLTLLHKKGITIKKIEPYSYPQNPDIKHMFFYFEGRKEAIPYFMLDDITWQTIQQVIMEYIK